jgi:hypothetical protein
MRGPDADETDAGTYSMVAGISDVETSGYIKRCRSLKRLLCRSNTSRRAVLCFESTECT